MTANFCLSAIWSDSVYICKPYMHDRGAALFEDKFVFLAYSIYHYSFTLLWEKENESFATFVYATGTWLENDSRSEN